MTEPDAVRVIAVLAAYWNRDVADTTARLWARELVGFETRDGLEAAQALGRVAQFFPALGPFLAEIRYQRDLRLEREAKMLPGDAPIAGADEVGVRHPDGRPMT